MTLAQSIRMKCCLAVAALLIAGSHGLTVTYAATIQRDKLVSTSASGNMQVGDVEYYQFDVQVFQLFDGTVQGDILILRLQFPSNAYTSLHCVGAKWANVIAMPAGSGNVSINAVLDPADPTCAVSNYVGPALTVELYGQPNLTNGGERRSEKGSGQVWQDGLSYKYNFQWDGFSETFIGSIGFASGTFGGTAATSRQYDRQRVD